MNAFSALTLADRAIASLPPRITCAALPVAAVDRFGVLRALSVNGTSSGLEFETAGA
jgi:hypothetical protein